MKNPSRQFRDAIYEQFSRIGKAVSSPKRLELLDLICQGEKTVESLAAETGLTLANTSQHLQVLRAARLIEAERDGLYVKYHVADQMVCEFYRSIRVIGENRLAEVEMVKRQFLEGKEGMEPMDRESLIQRIKEGSVIVLDVRPSDEYDAGHIPGSVSVPLNELKGILSGLPRGQEIVAYCRGPYCVLSVHAVEMLREQGFSAVRLEEGVQDWRALGFPVSVS
jgi:rhodanese-related sulfurtransferase